MNRRLFLKLLAAGASPVAAAWLCALPLQPATPALTSSATSTSTAVPPSAASTVAFTPSPTTRPRLTPTARPPSATPTSGPVPAPAGGLGSNSNYHLHSNCRPVTGLSVAMDISKDITSDIGFGFQLNAYSPQGANTVWQQYFFALVNTDNALQVFAWVDNWPSESFLQKRFNQTPGSDLINARKLMLTLPGATLPAGYKLSINLQYDQAQNVTGATFVVVDHTGQTTRNDIMLESLNYDVPGHNQPVSAEALAPIYSFELDLVGPIDGKHAYLSTGAGMITYTASSPLTVDNKDPQCTAARSTITLEAANSVYGALLAGPSQTITQSFDSVTPPPYQPGSALAGSQQFGHNQTDLFVIDSAGQLEVFSILAAGHWRATQLKGPAGMARSGAVVAVVPHSGVANRTDVFLIDQNGQLNTFWAGGDGNWNGPQTIGPQHVARSGVALAASPHWGASSRTDVFFVDSHGQLNVYWAVGSGAWHGPDPIGPLRLALPGNAKVATSRHFGIDNQTDVFVIGLNGQLNVFTADAAGNWSGAQTIGPAGLASSAAAMTASARFGKNGQTDVYLVDTHGQLNVFSAIASGSWNGPQTIGPAGLASSGAAIAVAPKPGTTDQTDVFVVDKNGQLNVFSADSSGRWSGPAMVGPQNAAPAGAPLAVSPQFGVPDQTDVFVISQTSANEPSWPIIFWANGANPWNGPKELVHDL